MEVWTLVAGAWGDALACYGNICHYVKEHGLEKVNVIYFGLHREITGFLKRQKYIDKVSVLALDQPVLTEKGLDPDVFFDYFQTMQLMTKDFNAWMQVTGLDKQIPNLVPTFIGGHYLEHPTDCHRDFEVCLPDSETDWSDFKSQHVPYLLFQPYSIQSCPLHTHWPHWMEALEWVLNTAHIPVMLVGTKTSVYDPHYVFPEVSHPKLINLVGQTKCLVDVLHIMAGAEGVITTSNCLSMWSILTKKPTLVVCQQLIRHLPDSAYYYNWINYEPNTVLDTTTTLEGFQQEYTNWFASLQKSQPISVP